MNLAIIAASQLAHLVRFFTIQGSGPIATVTLGAAIVVMVIGKGATKEA